VSETDPLDRQPLWCLVGPTASGKTALALDLCEESGAEVLSLDSMLVYRGLDIGTAKPSREEQARVPHHLMDLVCPSEPYDVQRYLADSARVLAYRYRLSDEEWEDLVASAGERAMRVFSEKHIEAPRPYLFRTIKRAIWEYLRKARREVAVLELPPVVDSQAGPETRSMWSELLERFMKECYQQLSGEEQRLFEALVIEGRSAAEVGEMFGLVPNAVGVRKFRVRKWLRECLKEHADLEDPFDETV